MRCLRSLHIAIILLLTPISLFARGASDKEHFMLRVRLQDPFNRDLEIRKRVELGKPFRVKKTNGRVRNTISGTLLPGSNGKYKMSLTIAEWESKKSNMRDGWDLELELNKAWGGGPIASFVYMRTVTLSRED